MEAGGGFFFAVSVQELQNGEYKYLKWLHWQTKWKYLPHKIIFELLLHILLWEE